MTTPVVVLPALTGKQALAWDALMAVAADLGEGWTLIGGQRPCPDRCPELDAASAHPHR